MPKECKCHCTDLTLMLFVYSDNTARFLLARLHMDTLVGKLNARQVRTALENLPEGMDNTYDEAMERVERQDDSRKELAKQVLSWITYAVRPLFVDELQHALAVMPDTTKLDPDDITDDEILTSICAGLVVIDEERNVIGLVRKQPNVECRNMVNSYSLQTTQHKSILNARESLDFQMLMPVSLRHASPICHSIYLARADAMTTTCS